MAVRIRCHCGYRVELPDAWAGRQGRCPQCHTVLQIPASQSQTAPQNPVQRPAQEPADLAARHKPGAHPRTALKPPRERSPAGAEDVFEDRDQVSSSRFRSLILLATLVASGAGLVAVGAFLLVRHDSPGDDRAGPAAERGVSAGQQADGPREVFRPQTETQAKKKPQTEELPKLPVGDALLAGSRKGPAADLPRIAGVPGQQPLDAWNLRELGVVIPRDATVIEIDGVVMPLRDVTELASRGEVPLLVPLGKHIVRFTRAGPTQVVEPRRWFLESYRQAAAQVQEEGRWSFDRLLELSRRHLDRFADPLVPHFWGNYYWQEGEHQAAARQYAWALEIAPTFAPAYLNLAQLSHQLGEEREAGAYLRLANLWNTQNAYGISRACNSLLVALGPEQETLVDDDAPDWLIPRHGELSARDQDMIRVLRSAAEFEPRLSERAKILNNIGAYFEHEGKAELALMHYRSAAASLGGVRLGTPERRVIEAILENLARLCRTAEMAEYQRYERLQAMVQP